MATERWQRLVRDLDEWTSASEVAPGWIEVVRRDGRTATVVMTADEYDSMLGIMAMSAEEGRDHVRAVLESLGPDESYVVYNNNYEVVPSATETLPARVGPDGPGDWITVDSDGREHRFEDWLVEQGLDQDPTLEPDRD